MYIKKFMSLCMVILMMLALSPMHLNAEDTDGVTILQNDDATDSFNSENGTMLIEFEVSEPLTMDETVVLSIPFGDVNTNIIPIDVAVYVRGGVKPYSYTLSATSSNWLSISADGVISGTRPAETCAWTTATLTVSDASGASIQRKIDVGSVIEVCDHVMVYHEEISPSFAFGGYKAYYSCGKCYRDYYDEEGTEEIVDHASLNIPVLKVKMMSGDGGVYIKGSDVPLTFEVNAPYMFWYNVKVGDTWLTFEDFEIVDFPFIIFPGEIFPGEDYENREVGPLYEYMPMTLGLNDEFDNTSELSPTGTTMHLKPSYLETLPDGQYQLSIGYSFPVVNAIDPGSITPPPGLNSREEEALATFTVKTQVKGDVVPPVNPDKPTASFSVPNTSAKD